MARSRLVLKTKKPKKGFDVESNAEFTEMNNFSFKEQVEAIRWVNERLSEIVFELDKKGFDPATVYFSIAVKD